MSPRLPAGLALTLTALLLSGHAAAAAKARPAASPSTPPASIAPLPAGPAAAAPAGPAAVSRVGCVDTIEHSVDRRITYFRHCPDTPSMVKFQGGTFQMGDPVGSGQPYERPLHEVRIPPFAIGRYEVTRDEWESCVAAGFCTDAKVPRIEGQGRLPVAGVSWTQAHAYVKWLVARTGRPYRLPSESEWEYAARAGATGTYNWGSFAESVCRHANAFDISGHAKQPDRDWYVNCDDGFAEAAPVGSFEANAWGVYDMLGNVWEWVEDCWHADYTGAPADGSAWTEGGNCRKRVNRGGGFENGPVTLRLSNRDADPADNTSIGLGFRVALSLPPAATAPAPAAAPEAAPK